MILQPINFVVIDEAQKLIALWADMYSTVGIRQRRTQRGR